MRRFGMGLGVRAMAGGEGLVWEVWDWLGEPVRAGWCDVMVG